MSTILAILPTIMFTTLLVTSIVACTGYIYWLHPTQQNARALTSRANWLALQLADERALRADLICWIEHESRVYKAPAVEIALKQRVKERLDLLEQLQKRRKELTA